MPQLDAAQCSRASLPAMNAIHISAVGIGVSELAASKTFYTELVGLEYRSHRESAVGADNVLVDARGNTLLLTSYTRPHNYKNNPVKVVLAVPDVAAFHAKLLAGGAREFSAPQTFGGMYLAMAYDPDGYIVECIQVASVPSPLLIAVGIGVSDLSGAADYYTRVLGMKFVRDIAVPGYMDEKELASTRKKGPSLVLMHYADKTRSYTDVPVRFVLAVDDAAALTDALRREDSSRVLEATKSQAGTGVVTAVLRDRDGYRLELEQAEAIVREGLTEL
jgi:catechol 2,3-dioxygenase-like lactoylglutathione lyase family enzyme